MGEPFSVPADYRWAKLRPLAGDALEVQYRHSLEELGKERGLLGTIFRKAQNKIQDPAKLQRLVSLIDEETWIGLDVDVKGTIYEGLLERNAAEGDRFDMVLTNPPFGKKSSFTVIGEGGAVTREREVYERDDFKTTTSNKQLNFLQHVMTILKTDGRAAIVLPDNVLFEGGAGERIRKRLLDQFDLHTVLRLPTGIFYSGGVKANVLFFDKKPASETPWTKAVWYYDLRTNQHFTLKQNPLKREHLDDFVACYNPENRHARKETERFHRFTYEELVARDKLNLDILWLKDESLEDADNLPPPHVLALEIVENLQAALAQFRSVAEDLGAEPDTIEAETAE